MENTVHVPVDLFDETSFVFCYHNDDDVHQLGIYFGSSRHRGIAKYGGNLEQLTSPKALYLRQYAELSRFQLIILPIRFLINDVNV